MTGHFLYYLVPCDRISCSLTMASKRKSITLEQKREVIRRKDAGEGNSAIGRVMGLHEATVRTIYRKREEILKSVKAYGSSFF